MAFDNAVLQVAPALEEVLHILQASIELDEAVQSIIKKSAKENDSIFLSLKHATTSKKAKVLNTTPLKQFAEQCLAQGIILDHANAGHDAKTALGVIGESLIERLLNAENRPRNQKGYDVLNKTGEKIEVKSTVDNKVKLSKHQYKDADYLLILLFDKHESKLVRVKFIPMPLLRAMKGYGTERNQSVSVMLNSTSFDISLLRLHEYFKSDYCYRRCSACEHAFMNAENSGFLALLEPCSLLNRCAFGEFHEKRYRYFKYLSDREEWVRAFELPSYKLYNKPNMNVSTEPPKDSQALSDVDGTDMIKYTLRNIIYNGVIRNEAWKDEHFTNHKLYRPLYIRFCNNLRKVKFTLLNVNSNLKTTLILPDVSDLDHGELLLYYKKHFP